MSHQNLKNDFKEIFNKISSEDLSLVFVVPIIITIIFLLPQTLQEPLRLNIQSPSWWQFLTSSFVHKDFSHYSNNLSLFLIFTILNIILISKTEKKTKFYLLFLIIILIVPLISNFITYKYLPQLKSTQGASDLVAAVFGFLPITLTYYFYKKNKKINREKLYYALLFYSGLFVWYIYKKHIILLIVCIIFYLCFLFIIKNQFLFIWRFLKENKNKLLTYVLIFCFLLYLLGFYALFPKNLTEGTSVVNIIGHYVGFVMGIFSAKLILK